MTIKNQMKNVSRYRTISSILLPVREFCFDYIRKAKEVVALKNQLNYVK